jgi:hypothetical protein
MSVNLGWCTGSSLSVGLLVLSVVATGGGCGARTDPLAGASVLSYETNSSTDPTAAPQGCRLCDTKSVECGYCLIQGVSPTYICLLGDHPSASRCSNLGEVHTSPGKWEFTCFYCG